MIISMNKVLVVVAHPDDEVLGCGATIRKILCSGGQVRVLILGEGSSCRYPRAMMESEEVRKNIQQRRQFSEKSFAILGVEDAVYGDLPCGRFDTVPIIDIGKQIEANIADFSPDTVMTHFGNDANSDHRLTFNAVVAATRPTPGTCVRTVLSFETLSSTEWRFVEVFKPNLFIDVEKHLETKMAAFNCYFLTEGAEFPFPRSAIGLSTLARYRGMQAGLNCAEAFEIIRSVSSMDPNNLHSSVGPGA